MLKKIYVTGMDDDATAAKVDAAVKSVAGVSSVTATPAKCQVAVEFDDGTAGIEDAINNAISGQGVIVVG